MVFLALTCIAGERVDKIPADGHESCLVEFALTNLDHSAGETYIVQGEGERLADGQPRSVQQEDKGAVCICPDFAARVFAQGCGVEQAQELFTRVDVGNKGLCPPFPVS